MVKLFYVVAKKYNISRAMCPKSASNLVMFSDIFRLYRKLSNSDGLFPIWSSDRKYVKGTTKVERLLLLFLCVAFFDWHFVAKFLMSSTILQKVFWQRFQDHKEKEKKYFYYFYMWQIMISNWWQNFLCSIVVFFLSWKPFWNDDFYTSSDDQNPTWPNPNIFVTFESNKKKTSTKK